MLKMRRAAMRLSAALVVGAVMIMACGCEDGQYIELPLDVLQQLTSSQTTASQSTLLNSDDAAANQSGEQPLATSTTMPENSVAPEAEPTATPMPTATATPTPTPASTPVPTETPKPTTTPEPTATPTPTATPAATPTPQPAADREDALMQENQIHEETINRLNANYQAKKDMLETERSMLMMDPDNSEFNTELEKNTMALDIAKVEYETAVAAENARHESELTRLGA